MSEGSLWKPSTLEVRLYLSDIPWTGERPGMYQQRKNPEAERSWPEGHATQR